MFKIGLCGGSGSGKGAVSAFFVERGYFAIDTDKICHQLFSSHCECTENLREEFGDAIFDASGCVDRKKLGEIVFSDKSKLKRLNEISHFHILAAVRKLISSLEKDENYRGALIDAPLLFESKFDSECDCTVAVISEEKKRIARIIERDNISKERALARIKNQSNDDSLISKTDFVIENNGSFEDLRNNTIRIIDEIENKYM